MIIYNTVVSLYGLVIKAASVRKEKAKQWVEGRKNWQSVLRQQMSVIGKSPRIWVHCASYGEFEQGRPLIEKIRTDYPKYKIVLSFFSPSGYEAFKTYTGAEVVCYLPLDSKKTAAEFIEIVNPDQAIFVKYEFWLHFLFELKNRNIPTYLVSATFKPHHPFFKWYGHIFRKSLLSFNKIFLQDEGSVNLLNNIGIKNVLVTGDTRFDRVSEIRRQFKGFDNLAAFKGNKFLLVAGSTWPKDDELVLEAFSELPNKNIKAIIAPHELDAGSIKLLTSKLEAGKFNYCLYSKGIDENAQILVLDVMGMLARIYYHGDAAYVGGGFNGGLHNTLEPAVYGIPVFFYGSEFQVYNEAVTMVELGTASRVDKSGEFAAEIKNLIEDPARREEIRSILKRFFDNNTNVSETIISHLSLG